MESAEEYDDCFDIQLKIDKIIEIIFMDPSSLLVIHSPNSYLLLKIQQRSEVSVKGMGKLPYPFENVKRIRENHIAFIHENQLHIFDLLQQNSLQIYSISRSQIYPERYQFEVYPLKDETIILFYKTSIFKGRPSNTYYEIHLLKLSETLNKIRKLKAQYPDLRKFGYSSGQVFSYQLSGYEIEIIFLESKITHRIVSIFNMFLMQISTNEAQIQLGFSNNELQNQLAVYIVSKEKISKTERKLRNTERHTVYDTTKHRSLVFKNCFNRRKRDPCLGIVRIIATKQAKLLHLIQNQLNTNIGPSFRQSIIEMLQ